MPKVSISYVIYNRFVQKDGSYPIKLRFTFNRKSTLFNINLFAREDDLFKQKKSEESKSRTIKSHVLKRKVEDLIRRYEDAANDFDPYLFPDWTVTEVAKYLSKIVHKDTFRLKFVEFSNSFISEKNKTSHQSALNYKAAVDALCAFFKEADFDISKITSSSMRGFESWLIKKHGENARAVSLYTSAISTIHKSARLKYNSEELEEVNIKNPFDYYTPPSPPAPKHRDLDLSVIQEMINNYQNLKGQERLSIAAFLLSFALMGMNTPDLYECERPTKDVLHYYRHKTQSRRADRAEIYVKIPKCILPLYNEYRDRGKKRAFNFYTRYSCYKNMQDAEKDGMKKFKERIHFNGRITNYSARHTWATLARSAKCNISMSIIDDCLNHVGSHQVSDIYAKKDWSVLWEANEKVVSCLDWSKL